MVKIIFFDWDTFYGRVIKDVTNSDWSHVGIISDETETQYVVHEALNKGLVKQFYDKTFIDSKIKDGTCAIRELYCFEVTEDVFKKICQKYFLKPYYKIIIIAKMQKKPQVNLRLLRPFLDSNQGPID